MVAIPLTQELYLFLNHTVTMVIPLVTYKPTFPPFSQRQIQA